MLMYVCVLIGMRRCSFEPVHFDAILNEINADYVAILSTCHRGDTLQRLVVNAILNGVFVAARLTVEDLNDCFVLVTSGRQEFIGASIVA